MNEIDELPVKNVKGELCGIIRKISLLKVLLESD